MQYKLPLIFELQPGGGYTVTSPSLPELITWGDALENVRDAPAAVIETDEDAGRSLPAGLEIPRPTGAVRAEMVVSVP